MIQKRNEDKLDDLHGVHIIADALIIAARDEKEHDRILRLVLQQAHDRGVKFNKDKIQFKVSSVTYIGNIVSEQGLKPDKSKVQAIVDMPLPNNVPSSQRLLGNVWLDT